MCSNESTGLAALAAGLDSLATEDLAAVPEAPAEQLEAFDAGPLLEAEPESEAVPLPAPDDEILPAAEEPAKKAKGRRRKS